MISTINDVEYDESIWLKLSCGGRDKTMYVYLPIQGTHVDWVQECYEKPYTIVMVVNWLN